MNKVRWAKDYNYSTAYVEVFENNKWVYYKKSSIYKQDLNGESAGYMTFINALKRGYQVESLYIKDSVA